MKQNRLFLTLTAGFTHFAADNLIRQADTFSFVGLRFAEATDFGRYLPKELFVVALQDNRGVGTLFCFGFHLDFLRKYEYDGVGIPYAYLEHLAYCAYAVADADQLELLGEAIIYPFYHIVQQGPVQAVDGAMALLVRRTLYRKHTIFYFQRDIRINLLL